MNQHPKTLFLFIDGLGLGPEHPEINPVHGGCCPRLERLLREHARAIDAGLDTAGTPQSATGQATLFTGENAAKFMGRHVEGCPGPRLKGFVREHNFFDKLAARGYRSTFSNAYYIDDLSEIERQRRQSVSTVAALKAFGQVRTSEDLKRNQAVYQDLTRDVLVKRGYAGPTVSPEEAGEHLVAIAEGYDFTLFEYFQTDLMAHRGTEEDVQRVLSDVDRLLSAVLPLWSRPGHLFILTSDHGNVEDLRNRCHTHNPVPFVTIGHGAEQLWEEVACLADVTPALLRLYPALKGQGVEHDLG